MTAAPKLKQSRIEYHGDATRTGRPGNDDADDPMSPAFIPVEERTPMGSARWWALKAKGRRTMTSGVFDA